MINNMHIICTKVQTMNMGSWVKLALLFLRKELYRTKQMIFILLPEDLVFGFRACLFYGSLVLPFVNQ